MDGASREICSSTAWPRSAVPSAAKDGTRMSGKLIMLPISKNTKQQMKNDSITLLSNTETPQSALRLQHDRYNLAQRWNIVDRICVPICNSRTAVSEDSNLPTNSCPRLWIVNQRHSWKKVTLEQQTEHHTKSRHGSEIQFAISRPSHVQ